MKKHGLSLVLKHVKKNPRHAQFKSAIIALSNNVNPFPLWQERFVPSLHVFNVCSRVLSGKVGATYEEWNALVNTVVDRMYKGRRGGENVRRACIYRESGIIAGWFIERRPILNLEIYNVSTSEINSIKKARDKVSIEKIRSMVFSATEEAESPRVLVPKTLKNGSISKCRIEYVDNPHYAKFTYLNWCAMCGRPGVRHRSIYKYPHGSVCIWCLSRIRKTEREQQKAIDGLAALSIELKEFNRKLKELKNGIK